ncbi:hypothetical protein NDU88_003282 [Pleurodeles waltl]|uniref:Succinate dehydrogenase assembly factor 3, mitochondrial n=1 Tax=Pleurodeles waltl TaxID=8319 RepID=A0AAV7MQA6_PLEWA|nr:hypothetical protein NDU88_003282 [Pleurodeles waltl]
MRNFLALHRPAAVIKESASAAGVRSPSARRSLQSSLDTWAAPLPVRGDGARRQRGDLMQLEDRLHPLDNEQGRGPEAYRQLLEVWEEYVVALEKLRCHDHVE